MIDEIPVIDADAWNSLVSDTIRAKPLRGVGVFLWETPDGVTVSMSAAGREFRHPWQMRGEWAESAADPRTLEFRVTVRPGFVNGRDVVIDMAGKESGRLDSRTGKPMERGNVALTDPQPPFLVVGSWRNPQASAGLSASLEGEMVSLPGEGFPPFFATVGVKPAAKGGAIDQSEAAQDPTRTRQIRAADIVLRTPRVATASQVQPLDPFSQAATVQLSTVFLNDALRSEPAHKLLCVPKFSPPREPTALERLLGTYTEPQADEFRIGTVWSVSPPDAADDAAPDQTWSAFFQYGAFWNLQHATRNEVPDAPQPPTTLRTGLPWADFFGNLQLSQSNDILQQVGAYLAGGDFRGIYWT